MVGGHVLTGHDRTTSPYAWHPACAFARLCEPLRDTETVERTIMAMVERQGGVYGTVEVEEEPQVQVQPRYV
jgi:hypothetical protein